MGRLLSALLLWLAVGLSSPAHAAGAKGPLVLAAASLQESLTAAADAWAAEGHPRPVISFAASSALARQVEAGAPADIFISADEPWMDELGKRGLLAPGTRTSFLGNRLVLIAPAGNGRAMQIDRRLPLARMLGGDGRLAIADPDAVPAGRYSKAALVSLGLWPSVEKRIARGDSVRAALALVERRASPLGIVYATDARASAQVRVVGSFPADSHPSISYPLAVLATSTNADAAGFRSFLLSTRGKAIFRRFGFTTH